MTAALANTFGKVNLARIRLEWVRLEIGLLIGALMMGA